MKYRYKAGIFTFSPGVSFPNYLAKNTQFNTTVNDAFSRVLPDFNLKIDLKKSKKISLNYSMQTQFTDVTKFARGYVLNSYSSIYARKPALERCTCSQH